MRLVAYIRVSKQGDRSGDAFQSPDQQRQTIGHAVALARARVVEEIIDIDQSGGTMDRPGLNRALAMLKSGQADGIVVARLDRFGRSLEVPTVIEGMAADGHTFLSASDQFDTSTPMGRFALGMMALVARLERERHIETWALSTSNAIKRGVAMKVPYGYKRGPQGRLVVSEPQATVVRTAFRLKASGVGIAQIARDLDAGGVRPAHASAWTRQSVRALLRVRTYLGEVHYGSHVTIDAHEPLVDRATWEAAQTTRRKVSRDSPVLLGFGLLRCAGCGYAMGASLSRGQRRYNCNRNHGGGRCPSPTSATAELVESFVVARFLERYGAARVQSARANAALVALEREVDAARFEFEVWRDDAEMRRMIGDSDYRAGMVARHARLESAVDAHAAAVRERGAERLAIDPAAWDGLTTPEQTQLLRAGIEHIALGRAVNTHAPIESRCVIAWVGDKPSHNGVVRGVASAITPLA